MARSRATHVVPGPVSGVGPAGPRPSVGSRRPRRLPQAGAEGPPATTVFERRDMPGVQWLTVHGPLTVAALADLAAEVAACDASRALLLDLSRATDIDGSDVAAIAGLYGALAARAAALLVLPGESTRRTAGLIERLLGARVTVVDRAGWGSRPGGWLNLMEDAPPARVSLRRRDARPAAAVAPGGGPLAGDAGEPARARAATLRRNGRRPAATTGPV